MDPFSGLDLIVKTSRKETNIARAMWGQAPDKRGTSPVRPAEDGAGPALPPVPPPVVEEAVPAGLTADNLQALSGEPVALTPEAFGLTAENIKALDNATRLRQLRLQSMQKSLSPPAEENVTSPTALVEFDGSRDDWKRHTKVKVYSQSTGKWHAGAVAKVLTPGSINDRLEIHYKKNGTRNKKVLPRYSKMVMSREATQNSSSNSGSGDDAKIQTSPPPEPAQETRLPAGWTEHRCKTSGRYYYYNKETKTTLWDGDALKHGIITQIKVKTMRSG